MASVPHDPAAVVDRPKRSFLQSQHGRRRIGRAIAYLLLISGSVAMLLPLIWLVRSSFKTAPFGRYTINTMVIEVLVVIGTVASSTISAYGFSRLRWTGRDQVFAVLMTTLMLPYTVTLVPTFIIWAKLGLVNTFAPLTIPAWFGGGMFNVFLLRQFFRTLPRDLDDSAMLDGASPMRILWDIVIPLSRPALTTIAIFSFLYTWNDFLGPLIYLNDSSKFTLALGLDRFKGLHTAEWQLLMAASTVVLAPALILFFIAQRYFVEGIALTGLKG